MNSYPRRISASAVEPITLADALAHLREESGVADSYIEALITTARETCENRIERTLISTQWRLTMPGFLDEIRLTQPPVISVESIKYRDADGVLQTLDSSLYQVDLTREPALIVPAPGGEWPTVQSDRLDAVLIEYTAGYGDEADDVPRPLRQWMLLAIGDMYEARRSGNDKPTVAHHFVDSLLDPYRMLGL